MIHSSAHGTSNVVFCPKIDAPTAHDDSGYQAPQGPLALPLLLLTALLLPACITQRPVVVAPKTSLENDLLGTFALWEAEPRLVNPHSAPSRQTPRLRALQALLNRHVRHAHLQGLKGENLVREEKTGRVTGDSEAIRQAGRAPEEIAKTVNAENADREAIVQWIVAMAKMRGAKAARRAAEDLVALRLKVAAMPLEVARGTKEPESGPPGK